MFALTTILYDKFIALVERFTQRKNWTIELSFLLFIYILFVAFPSFDLLNKDFAGGWNILFQHAGHLLTPQHFSPESHEAKLAFRLLIPALVHFLHLNIFGVLAIQFLAGWLSWMIFIKIAEKYTGDKVIAVILACAMACINFSKATLDIRGVFFDNIAFLFLLIPFLYTRAAIIFICITLAAWVDERAFIASSVLLLFLFFARDKKNRVLKISSVLSAWAGYLGLRFYLSQTYHLETPVDGTGFSVLMNQMNNWLLGIISGLEGFWILPLLFIYYKAKDGKWLDAVLFSGAVFIMIIVSLSVADISRSMSYLFIAVPLILYYISQKESIVDLRKTAAVVLLISFLFPVCSFSSVNEAYWSYPLPVQIFRMLFMQS